MYYLIDAILLYHLMLVCLGDCSILSLEIDKPNFISYRIDAYLNVHTLFIL